MVGVQSTPRLPDLVRSESGRADVVTAVHETSPAKALKPRLLDRVREAIRARHYSRRSEKAYVQWIKRYIFFHGKRHPAEMGVAELTAFHTSLAVQGRVAASTQNQALRPEMNKIERPEGPPQAETVREPNRGGLRR